MEHIVETNKSVWNW